ncbi:MAG: DUF4411 family protein [Gammaproteobacteria bacterium]|nr:DUF4411 family protein [Gammaproteobacteria bacterium]MYD79509.1 DUF4411 family protein [Gammaproteobacteria bacterium]
MAYLLDADVLIRAKRMHYRFTFCPAFWDWLEAAHDKGKVFSVESIGNQLIAGDDELSYWAREQGSDFFRSPGRATIGALDQVSAWVQSQSYEAPAIRSFMQDPDYWLVAEAVAGEHIVVTHEVRSTSVKRIKIPNVCDGSGIDCITPFEMLHDEKARFVLERP